MQVATFYGETFRLRGVGAFDYLGRMPAQTTPIRELVNSLVTPSRADRLRHLEVLAPRAATHASWPEWVAPAVREAFEQRGVERPRSEEHTSELQSLMRISYAVFCLKKKNQNRHNTTK